MNDWANNGSDPEDREEANESFKYSYKSKSTELDLNSLQLKELPNFMSQLTDLESIDLNFNKLTELPENLNELPKLESLNLRENNLNTHLKTLAN